MCHVCSLVTVLRTRRDLALCSVDVSVGSLALVLGSPVVVTRGVLGSIGRAGRMEKMVEMDVIKGSFVVAFCGSGTGHMMQALTWTRTLQAAGMTLTGVITDTDAAQKLIDELIKPLACQPVLPAIGHCDQRRRATAQGPARALACVKGLEQASERIRAFLAESKASLILNMWQISLGKYLQLNPLPKNVRVVHLAAQFCHLSVRARDVRGGFMAAAAMARSMSWPPSSGPAGSAWPSRPAQARISARKALVAKSSGGARSGADSRKLLAPIIDVPPALSAASSPSSTSSALAAAADSLLPLAPARRLERLLHANPLGAEGPEVHVFTF